MNCKIKVLKDTPFDQANTILCLENFKYRYAYLFNVGDSDASVIDNIKGDYYEYMIDLTQWFKVIEESNFKVGDWVWNESVAKAFCITSYVGNTKSFTPNQCSIDAVNTCTETYKRLASPDEIRYYDLKPFCDGTVLIGNCKCYYFNNVWKELLGISLAVATYIKFKKEFDSISSGHSVWSCIPDGIMIGCKKISHEEVIDVAKHLFLI